MDNIEDLKLDDYVEKWKITYLDYKSGERVHYMRCSWDSHEKAEDELTRIKAEMSIRKKQHAKPDRGYFKIKPFMVRIY